MRIHPDAGAARRVIMIDGARRGQEGLRVFGVDPAFDGMAADRDLILPVAERPAGGDMQLFLDDIHPGDHFRDRMLNLHPGIHLNKIKLAVLVQEFKGARAAIGQRPTGRHAALADLLTQGRVQARRRGLFDDFLMAALHGAVPFAEVNRIALAVGQHLNLNMARALQKFFHIHHVIAEGRARLGAGQGDRL